MPAESLRLFVALELPERIVTELDAVQTRLRRHGLNLRWVRPPNIHLTLKFLGEVRAEKVPEIESTLGGVAATTGGFPMEIGGFGAFPTIRKPRVLWVGVDPSPALRCLKQDIEWALSDCGFERETRAFHPHFTLGRATKEDGAGAFRGLDDRSADLSYSAEVKVWKVDLMESHLSVSGPRYEVLSSFPLKGPKGR